MKVKISLRDWMQNIISAFKAFMNDRVLRMSASLAYYTIFSLPGLLFIITGLSGIFFGKDAVEGIIYTHLKSVVGSDVAVSIQETVKGVALNHNNILSTCIGFIILMFSASGIFGEIQDSINIIWNVKALPQKGFRALIMDRLFSFSMLLILGFILMVALMVNTIMDVFIDTLSQTLSWDFLKQLFILDYLLTFIVIIMIFAFIYKYLPDVKLKWKEVLIGGTFSTILFMIGKLLLGFYFQSTNMINTYGAAGNVIAILLWVYYSSIILFFGAELIYAMVKRKGRKIMTRNYAMIREK